MNKELISGKQTQLEDAEMTQSIDQSLAKNFGFSVPNVSFEKISYDRILGENLSAYQEKHPEVPFHEIIDIIRSKADQDYLDQIARHCSPAPS